MWNIDRTDESATWIISLDEDAREAILEKLYILQDTGPSLGRPLVDGIKGSKYPNMKELRIQNNNRVFRIFFAFDPARSVILLIGRDKKGDDQFYEKMVPLADKLYTLHLKKLEEKKNDKKRKK